MTAAGRDRVASVATSAVVGGAAGAAGGPAGRAGRRRRRGRGRRRAGRRRGGGSGLPAAGRDPGPVAAHRGQRRAGRAPGVGGRAAGPVAVGTAAGAVAGALGLRPQKVVWGPLVVRRRPRRRPPARHAPAVAGGAVLAYRLTSALLFRDAQVTPAGRAGPRRGPAVRGAAGGPLAPGRATSRTWRTRWAVPTSPVRPTSASWPRWTSWPGPTSIPPPPTRRSEFYEHTTRFSLDIVPSWRPWVRPGYLLYRTLVARPLGQASIPMNQREALRGVRSRIDTISLDGDDTVAVRGWIRSYADDDEPIYVGIYTTYRHGAAATSASGSRSRRPASRPRWCRGPGPGRPGADDPQRARPSRPLPHVVDPATWT